MNSVSHINTRTSPLLSLRLSLEWKSGTFVFGSTTIHPKEPSHSAAKMPLAPSTAAGTVWHGVRTRLFPLALVCIVVLVLERHKQDLSSGVVARHQSTQENEGQKPFTRHAILMSGMAVRSGMDCWESQMNAFVDSFGRRQDVYVVLGLGGTGMDQPTDEETAVIQFYESRPNVRAVLVDYTPAEDFGGTPLASVMSGAPYDHNGILEKVSMAKNIPLQFWKVLLAWELMEEVTGGPSKHKYDMIVRMRPDLYLPHMHGTARRLIWTSSRLKPLLRGCGEGIAPPSNQQTAVNPCRHLASRSRTWDV